jgi:hypothetical protein
MSSNLTLRACLGDVDFDTPLSEVLTQLGATDIIRLGCYLQLAGKTAINTELANRSEEVELPVSRIQGMGSMTKNKLELRFPNA